MSSAMDQLTTPAIRRGLVWVSLCLCWACQAPRVAFTPLPCTVENTPFVSIGAEQGGTELASDAGVAPGFVSFQANVSFAMPGEVIESYDWELVSGAGPLTVAGPSASLEVLDGGQYEIALTVTDSDGCVGTSAGFAVHSAPP